MGASERKNKEIDFILKNFNFAYPTRETNTSNAILAGYKYFQNVLFNYFFIILQFLIYTHSNYVKYKIIKIWNRQNSKRYSDQTKADFAQN